MAEALKHFFSPALVRRIAAALGAAHPSFRSQAFVKDACRGLEDLELLARGNHIANAMHQHLPPSYPEAVDVIVRSLGSVHASDELEGAGMAPFFYLPHVTFVATYGVDDFETSMKAQYELTQRFTCEFSIRPFLVRYPEKTLAILKRWSKDPSPHVRRLVSEGTRPLLPWASRVPWITKEPERVLPLLEMLKDDPASVVRRSVANHLNDVSKARPDLVCDVAERWLDGATPERRALVKHALRSAVKKGNLRALGLLGFGEAPKVQIADVSFEPRRVRIGDKTKIAFSVRSSAARSQTLAVDLVVHFVKAHGGASPKVFKVATVTVPPRDTTTVAKTISLAVHTTRKPYAGRHAVEALINGQRFDLGAFVVATA
jgi:3-methyladenine DNA glycosylase AlkC